MSATRIRVRMMPPASVRAEVEQYAKAYDCTISRAAAALILVGLLEGARAHRTEIEKTAPRLERRRGEVRSVAVADAAELSSMVPIPIIEAARTKLVPLVEGQIRHRYPEPPRVSNGLLATALLLIGARIVAADDYALRQAFTTIDAYDQAPSDFTVADLEGALLAA